MRNTGQSPAQQEQAALTPRQALRWSGTLSALSAHDRTLLLSRERAIPPDEVRRGTERIIAAVRVDGDEALRQFTRAFHGLVVDTFEVSLQQRLAALAAVPRDLRRALERAIRNVATVHRETMPRLVKVTPEPGVTIIRRPDPITRVGVYAPGGRAAYPSSVIMAVVPARVAGVPEVILCTPPGRSGLPHAITLAAAELAGADRVFALGGAGAIAAMALGTNSVPACDRVVGPGNAYVAEAKRQLAGIVATDCPAGPSEVLVIADATVSPVQVAAELIAQAEHDPAAVALAIVTEEQLRERVIAALAAELLPAQRRAVVERALAANGGVLTASLDEAVAFANAFAPEHVVIAVTDCDGAARRIRTAGTIIMGRGASAVFGDYLTGANHVLPTGGAGHAYSGLSVTDFLRFTTIQTVSPTATPDLVRDIAVLAAAEGLPGHARAAWASAVAALKDAGSGSAPVSAEHFSSRDGDRR